MLIVGVTKKLGLGSTKTEFWSTNVGGVYEIQGSCKVRVKVLVVLVSAPVPPQVYVATRV